MSNETDGGLMQPSAIAKRQFSNGVYINIIISIVFKFNSEIKIIPANFRDVFPVAK
jgi:hypothetical protein